jgi:hypothetical protein
LSLIYLRISRAVELVLIKIVSPFSTNSAAFFAIRFFHLSSNVSLLSLSLNPSTK